jgi:hypothetical protein
MSTQPCDVTGKWIGTWWPKTATPADDQCKSLVCTVDCRDGKWRAVFEAECDQAYTFTVAMEGCPSGGAVLFKGTTDLGEQGGVFDWIGRADQQEFVGFFTSAHYVGEFHLERTT